MASLGHPCNFQRLSRLGSVTARHCSSGRQPNFAALTGQPSRWALAHILVSCFFVRLRISERRKTIGAWNFACVFDYHPDRSSLIFVNFGDSRRRHYYKVAHYFRDELHTHRIWVHAYVQMTPGKNFRDEARWAVGIASGSVGQSELGATASRKAVYGGICVLQAC